MREESIVIKFSDARRTDRGASEKSMALAEPEASGRSAGANTVRRSFPSHRTLCHTEVIPWDGYCPNTLEELEQSGYELGL